MKSIFRGLCLAIGLWGSAWVAYGADLDDFLGRLNIQAQADMGAFSARISSHFGVPQVEVRGLLGRTDAPADAFMIFQLSRMTRLPVERVVQSYENGKGKSWGHLAQELGIKPGSPAFHALKSGDFGFGGGMEDPGKGRGRGHGKGPGR